MTAGPLMDTFLSRFVELAGSDLYLTVGYPASVRVSDKIVALTEEALTEADIDEIINAIMDDEKQSEFYSTLEFNMPLQWKEGMRFRVNVFRQQQRTGLVIRRIRTDIPTLDSLRLPKVYGDLIMEQRGLVLVVGPTGSGKSTSLASMIGYRNRNGYGHIITVEDPIEFVHKHDGCIITQRDVGVDTFSFSMALKNTLRQRPDVVLIGEIRDKDTMEHAMRFAETGHLCVSTLHAGNVVQALERVLNFFSAEHHHTLLYNLSMNIRAIVAQRLVLAQDGSRAMAAEVMLNRGLIRNLIQEGRIKDIPEMMGKNRGEGMQMLDQSLFALYSDKIISEEVAVAEADNPANLRLMIRQTQTARPSGPALTLRNPNNF